MDDYQWGSYPAPRVSQANTNNLEFELSALNSGLGSERNCLHYWSLASTTKDSNCLPALFAGLSIDWALYSFPLPRTNILMNECN